MNILLIGSGGREHALAWALRKSPLLGRLYCAPGNGGIAGIAECVALDALDFDAVTAFVRARDIGFVIVGPEAPLVAGLVDHLTAQGIMAFGPTAAAARHQVVGYLNGYVHRIILWFYKAGVKKQFARRQQRKICVSRHSFSTFKEFVYLSRCPPPPID